MSVPLSGNEVSDRIEAKILNGDLAVGARLPPERALAEQYGVGRPLVREALRGLREQGLIESHVGRGTFVAGLDISSQRQSLTAFVRAGKITTRDLIDARHMLECEAAAKAALHHDETDAERLQEALAAFEVATSLPLMAERDVAIHEAVVTAAHNPVIRHMFASIEPLIRAMVLRSLVDRQIRDRAAPQHSLIVQAVLNRDAEGARREAARHMQPATEMYGGDLDRPLGDVFEVAAARQATDQ